MAVPWSLWGMIHVTTEHERNRFPSRSTSQGKRSGLAHLPPFQFHVPPLEGAFFGSFLCHEQHVHSRKGVSKPPPDMDLHGCRVKAKGTGSTANPAYRWEGGICLPEREIKKGSSARRHNVASTYPNTPWDCHICRSVGVVPGGSIAVP